MDAQTIPANLADFIGEVRQRGVAIAEPEAIIAGKFPLWGREIDAVPQAKLEMLLSDLSLDRVSLGEGVKFTKSPDEIRSLFDDYLKFVRMIGAVKGYNIFSEEKPEDDPYKVLPHLSEEQRKEYKFFLYIGLHGNGGFAEQFGDYLGAAHNSQNHELFRERISHRYATPKYTLDENLLFMLCAGANVHHDAAEFFVFPLLDPQLKERYSGDMLILAQAFIRKLQQYHDDLLNIPEWRQRYTKPIAAIKEFYGI